MKRRDVLGGMTPIMGLVGGAALLAGAAEAQGLFPAAPGFTAAQAAQGKTAYEKNCVSCHGANLEGNQFGPTLKGPVFEGHWRGQSPAALATFILTKMPPAGPGTLGSDTYANIQAYILAANGQRPSGAGQAVAAAPDAGQSRAPDARPTVPPERDAGYKAAMAGRTAKLAAMTPVTDAMLRQPQAADWLIWRRTYEGVGYSPLKQINKANIGQLRQAWAWSLPISQNEITPLVHDGVMFIESGNTVQAIDAVNGDLLWQYIRPLAEDYENGKASRVKTMAIYGDKVFAPFVDGHMVALDVKTGKVAWDHEVIIPALADQKGRPEGVALHLNGGPIVAKGKLIMGVSLGTDNSKGGCFIIALDANTGQEVWRFHTIAQPGEPGGDTWNGAPAEERYGGGVWTAGSFDPELNLVYFGIGNTYDTATLLEPRNGKVTKNDGLYTDSTVALNVDTGKLAWHFQHVKRDVWDLDWVFEQSLVTVPVNGRPRNLVVTGGKAAMFEGVDRATGEYIFTKDLGLQNLVTAVDPKTGEKTINPAVQPEAGKAKFLCPSPFGARSWPATSFNPNTKILYVGAAESCTDFTYAPRSAAETAAGGVDSKFATRRNPKNDGTFGRINAIDLKTRKVVWSKHQRSPISSSMLSTGGGLTFNGSLDRYFNAYDEMTGKVLWRTRLNAPPSSSPITYSVGGKQYVAVVSGGGSAYDAGTRGLTPELDGPAGGTTVIVFELPGKR